MSGEAEPVVRTWLVAVPGQVRGFYERVGLALLGPGAPGAFRSGSGKFEADWGLMWELLMICQPKNMRLFNRRGWFVGAPASPHVEMEGVY